MEHLFLMFLDHTRRSTVGRTPLDELITRPEESYRLCCVVVCDLETSKMDAPYIYDISRLRVKQTKEQLVTLVLFLPVWLLFIYRSIEQNLFFFFLGGGVVTCYSANLQETFHIYVRLLLCSHEIDTGLQPEHEIFRK